MCHKLLVENSQFILYAIRNLQALLNKLIQKQEEKRGRIKEIMNERERWEKTEG